MPTLYTGVCVLKQSLQPYIITIMHNSNILLLLSSLLLLLLLLLILLYIIHFIYNNELSILLLFNIKNRYCVLLCFFCQCIPLVFLLGCSWQLSVKFMIIWVAACFPLWCYMQCRLPGPTLQGWGVVLTSVGRPLGSLILIARFLSATTVPGKCSYHSFSSQMFYFFSLVYFFSIVTNVESDMSCIQ